MKGRGPGAWWVSSAATLPWRPPGGPQPPLASQQLQSPWPGLLRTTLVKIQQNCILFLFHCCFILTTLHFPFFPEWQRIWCGGSVSEVRQQQFPARRPSGAGQSCGSTWVPGPLTAASVSQAFLVFFYLPRDTSRCPYIGISIH